MEQLKSKQLMEQRAKLIHDAREVLKKEQLTAEDRSNHDKIMADADLLKADIDRHVKLEAEERAQAVPVVDGGDVPAETRAAEQKKHEVRYAAAFRNYMQFGTEISAEDKQVLRSRFVAPENGKEQRAQTITTTGGGYTVPQGFEADIERAQKFFMSGILGLAQIIDTGGGNPLPWPTIDDTSNTGEDKAINTAAAAQDMVFGQKTLGAFKMDSGLVLVPNELFEDTGVNLEGLLAEVLGERIGRRRNTKYTTGVGTTDFQGVVVGSSLGVTGASATVIAADELFDLYHSVDPAYRQSPKCAWMMNDLTVKAIRKLKDSQNRYLWEASLQAGGPDTLMGKPVYTNNDMATIATTNKTILFGDFSKFKIRNVRNLVLRRLNERYADADQVGFILWYRGDSQVISASTAALKYYAQL